MLGANSVLGTIAPIDSRHSARLVGRFMLRLAEFLPFFEETGGPLQWSEMVTGLLRMNYVTDMLAVLRDNRIVNLTPEGLASVLLLSNRSINNFAPSWLEDTVDAIAQAAGQPRAEIEGARRELAYFTETLQYVHLGWPEDIFVMSRRQAEAAERARAAEA